MRKTEGERIIIIEDAKGTAVGYKTLLEAAGYEVTICLTGKEAQELIDRGSKFDLAIMDIMLPPEDPERYTLAESQDTGLRLIEQMTKKDICRRFYVITVRSSLRDEVERLCRGAGIAITFESKLDYEPEKLKDNVAALLSQFAGGLGGSLLTEFEEHVQKIDEQAGRTAILTEEERGSLMVSMQWIEETLRGREKSGFFRRTLGDPGVRELWREIANRAIGVLGPDYLPHAKGALRKQIEKTICAIEEWNRNHWQEDQ